MLKKILLFMIVGALGLVGYSRYSGTLTETARAGYVANNMFHDAAWTGQEPQAQLVSEDTYNNSDGAYRDGLYLGKLDAEHNRTYHVARGRWATAKDRQEFVNGYNRSFSDGSLRIAQKTNAQSLAD
jgi:hypothetical protein